jgi:hypothetical protein
VKQIAEGRDRQLAAGVQVVTIRMILRVAYTYFTADERRAGRLREGDAIDLALTTEWRPGPWWVAGTLRAVIRGKAERANPSGRLVPETRNSNGDEFRAGAAVGYVLTDAWGIQPRVDVLHVSANDFPEGDPLHDGGRTKVSFGPGTWTPSRTFGVEAGVRYFVMDVERSPFFQQACTLHGVHVDLRLTYRY